jgi:hypothetical protein
LNLSIEKILYHPPDYYILGCRAALIHTSITIKASFIHEEVGELLQKQTHSLKKEFQAVCEHITKQTLNRQTFYIYNSQKGEHKKP